MRLKLCKTIKTFVLFFFGAFIFVIFSSINVDNVDSSSEKLDQNFLKHGNEHDRGIRVVKRSLMQNESAKKVLVKSHATKRPISANLKALTTNVPSYTKKIRTDEDITELRDIFISVKTTFKFHKRRLDLVLDTWWNLAREQTYFFTDKDDPEYQKKLGDRIINTKCPAIHDRRALCCKMAQEFDYFVQSQKRWFCHVDDDTYVNIPELLKLLQNYNHSQPWYLGKPSLNHPLEIRDPDHRGQKTAFWFATGGAGVCISRSLAQQIMPYTSGGKLSSVCDKIRLPDDCSLGYIISTFAKTTLTIVKEFHSHLEGLWSINAVNLKQQITLSYGSRSNKKLNVVSVQGMNETIDPTRIKSVHCTLFPHLELCKAKSLL